MFYRRVQSVAESSADRLDFGKTRPKRDQFSNSNCFRGKYEWTRDLDSSKGLLQMKIEEREREKKKKRWCYLFRSERGGRRVDPKITSSVSNAFALIRPWAYLNAAESSLQSSSLDPTFFLLKGPPPRDKFDFCELRGITCPSYEGSIIDELKNQSS